MYKKFNKLDEFYSLMPNPTERQKELLSLYYSARRECDPERKVPTDTLRNVAKLSDYEEDVAIFIMKKVDDYFMEIKAEQIRNQK